MVAWGKDGRTMTMDIATLRLKQVSVHASTFCCSDQSSAYLCARSTCIHTLRKKEFSGNLSNAAATVRCISRATLDGPWPAPMTLRFDGIDKVAQRFALSYPWINTTTEVIRRLVSIARLMLCHIRTRIEKHACKRCEKIRKQRISLKYACVFWWKREQKIECLHTSVT